jgi:hypothetical protein
MRTGEGKERGREHFGFKKLARKENDDLKEETMKKFLV